MKFWRNSKVELAGVVAARLDALFLADLQKDRQGGCAACWISFTGSAQIIHLVQRPDLDLAGAWHGVGAALDPCEGAAVFAICGHGLLQSGHCR